MIVDQYTVYTTTCVINLLQALVSCVSIVRHSLHHIATFLKSATPSVSFEYADSSSDWRKMKINTIAKETGHHCDVH